MAGHLQLGGELKNGTKKDAKTIVDKWPKESTRIIRVGL